MSESSKETGEKLPEPPSEEEKRKHELTRWPKATRSRKANFEVSEKKQQASLVSTDFKFTGTRDEEKADEVKDALAISLVMVDQETVYVHAIPLPSKEVASYLVEEVCRVLTLLSGKVIAANRH